jgi:hypothetical protein
MDKLIRTLALFGRPFPPELRELYFQVERNYAKRPAALADLQEPARTPPKASRSSGTLERPRPPNETTSGDLLGNPGDEPQARHFE